MVAPAVARITTKGQVTIPQEVREYLGLREGDRIEFVNENGRMTVRPYRAPANPFEKWSGRLPAFGSVDELLHWQRDIRESD
jgi:AbrB family looped-hinge helix DNA binding protein